MFYNTVQQHLLAPEHEITAMVKTFFRLLCGVQNVKQNVLAFLIATSRSEGGYLPEEQAGPIFKYVADRGLAFMKAKVDKRTKLARFGRGQKQCGVVPYFP
jgi:phage I-like protein